MVAVERATPLILALGFSVAGCGAFAQSTDYWQLVDSKGDQLPKDYAMVELNAKSDNQVSDVPAYADLILTYLGCPAAAQPGSPAERQPKQASAAPAPCKLGKLYVDPAADGSPTGRAFAQALTEALTQSHMVELTSSAEEADALFICRDELAEYRKREADESEQREVNQVSRGSQGKDEAGGQTSFQFRKTRWGMSRQQVRTSESMRPAADKPDRVVYEVRVASTDCLLVYSLVEDKLVGADYTFTQEHTNPSDYITDFMRIKGVMSEKYGKPGTDDVIWGDDPFDVKDHPEDWGIAVAEGYLEYEATWETPLTRITLLLSGDNYTSTLAAYYESKQFTGLQKRNERDKAKDEF